MNAQQLAERADAAEKTAARSAGEPTRRSGRSGRPRLISLRPGRISTRPNEPW